MKKLITVIILLLTISFGVACTTKKSDTPGISLKFDVTNLTDEDFRAVGTAEVPGAVKEDFKNIEFNLEVKHGSNISNRKIMVPNLRSVANSSTSTINRYWFGEGGSQDNMNENFAKYTYKFVFYSKGMDEQAIKDLFKNQEVKVSWTTESGNQGKVLTLGDAIQFK
ncbi:MAG: hypothetical protein ACM3X7_10855 [Solirubrobacterales bacterium]